MEVFDANADSKGDKAQRDCCRSPMIALNGGQGKSCENQHKSIDTHKKHFRADSRGTPVRAKHRGLDSK